MENPSHILIAGGPRTGKTSLANRLGQEMGLPVRHTDDLIGRFDWSGVSEEVARWMDAEGPWIIEGVAVPRALRKWLFVNQECLGPGTGAKPADRIYWLDQPLVALSGGQSSMAKGCFTVWSEIFPTLYTRQVEILSADNAPIPSAYFASPGLKSPVLPSPTVETLSDAQPARPGTLRNALAHRRRFL